MPHPAHPNTDHTRNVLLSFLAFIQDSNELCAAQLVDDFLDKLWLERSMLPSVPNMNDRAAFLVHFDSEAEAKEFEERILDTPENQMPQDAITVKNGGAPTSFYWAWLISQALER